MNILNRPHQYSVSEFYLLLKLGIWQGGTVDFWGRTEIIPSGDDFIRSTDLYTHYNASSLVRKHLTAGVYLLDLFYMGKDPAGDRHIYRLVIAVCRNDMMHPEALYHIRVCNSIPMREFFPALRNDDGVLGSRLRKKRLFNHPGSIQTRLKPTWPKVIFRH